MDYTFTLDAYGMASAHFVMPHEAFGQLFNEELNSLSVIDSLLEKITELEHNRLNSWRYCGSELTLNLDKFEVEVSAIASDDAEDTDIEDDFDYGFSHYNEESQAGCGLEDFQQALVSWRDVIQQQHNS